MSEEPQERGFDAFISYARGPDSAIAIALRRGLHRFGRTLFALRAMRVFLDVSSLDVAGPLPRRLTRALESSRHLIVVASPEASRREWVERELRHWIALGRGERLIIALADGELVWDEEQSRWDPARSTAAPAALLDAFREEPLWLDLRRWRAGRAPDLSDPDFATAIARLSSAIQGRSIDELVGDDVVEQRRLVRLRRWAIGLLAAFALGAAGAALYATQQRRAAETEAERAEIRALAAQARAHLAALPDLALEKSTTAFERNAAATFAVLRETYEAGHEVLSAARTTEVLDSPRNVDLGAFTAIRAMAVNPEKPLLAVGTDTGLYLLDLDLNAIRPMGRGPDGDSLYVLALAWDATGGALAVAGRSRGDFAAPGDGEADTTSGWLSVLDETGSIRDTLEPANGEALAPIGAVAWSGHRLAAGDRRGRVWIADPAGRSLAPLSGPTGRAVNALVRGDDGWWAAEGPGRELLIREWTGAEPERLALTWRSDAGGIVTVPTAHSFGVDCMAPSAGWLRAAVTCGRDGWLGIWRPDRSSLGGLRLEHRARTFAAGVSSAAIDASGGLIVSGSASGEILLAFADGSSATPLMKGHDGPVTALAWFGPGRVLSGGADGTLRAWDVADLVAQRIALPSYDVRAAVAEDRIAVLTVDEGSARIVDSRPWPEDEHSEGQVPYAFAVDRGGEVAAVSLVAPDSYPYLGPLAAGFSGGPPRSTVELWRSGGERSPLVDLGAPVGAASFSRDGSRLAVGYGSEMVMPDQRANLVAALRQPPDPAAPSPAATPEVRRIQAVVLDALVGGFAVLDRSGALVARVAREDGIGVQKVASNPWATSESPWFVSTWGGDSIQLWSRDGRAIGAPSKLIDHAPIRSISALAFIEGGAKVVAALSSQIGGIPGVPRTSDPTAAEGRPSPDLAIVALQSGRVVEIVTDHVVPIASIATSGDGRTFAVSEGGMPGDGARRASLWTSDGAPIASPTPRHFRPILASRITPAGLLETLDAEGDQKHWPVTPEAVRARLAARWNSLSAPRLARALVDEVDAADGDEQRLELLQRAIALQPTSASAFGRRARVHHGMGRATEAGADHDRAVELSPHEWIYLHNRALWRAETGDDAGAESDLSAAIAVFDASWMPILEPSEAEAKRVVTMSAEMRTMRAQAKGLLYELRAKTRCRQGQHAGAVDDASIASRLGRSTTFVGRLRVETGSGDGSACELANESP